MGCPRTCFAPNRAGAHLWLPTEGVADPPDDPGLAPLPALPRVTREAITAFPAHVLVNYEP